MQTPGTSHLQRKLARTLCAALCSLVLPGCFSAAPEPAALAGSGDAEAGKCMSAADAEQMADQVLQLVNMERAEAGLPPVVYNETLAKIAGDYACRMIEGDFFTHADPDSGYGPLERAFSKGYRFVAVGENLAASQRTAADVVRVWMESESHRANILNPRWEETGIGVRIGGKYEIYWVQEFGEPIDF